uniref:Uncharacterized protein n=1 Tax=Strigamia maritima TaxID=126957 RepID=T1JPF8_STRMM
MHCTEIELCPKICVLLLTNENVLENRTAVENWFKVEMIKIGNHIRPTTKSFLAPSGDREKNSVRKSFRKLGRIVEKKPITRLRLFMD